MSTAPLSYDQVYALARSVGCSADQAIVATAIAAAESGLNPHNLGDQSLAKNGSRGLWQVFSGAWSLKDLGIKSYDELYDPAVNARAMWLISNHAKNWHPWSTYNDGAYKKHLTAATAAAARAAQHLPAAPPEEPVSVDWRGVKLDARTRDMMIEVDRLVGSIPIRPSQGSYSNGSLSAGTHSGGGAIDISVRGLSEAQILEVVRVMRTVGFAAWWRRLPEWSQPQHIHAIAVGCKDLNPIAAQQVVALRKGYNGLGHLGEGGKDRHADMRLPVISWEFYLARRDAPKVAYPATIKVKPWGVGKDVSTLQRALIDAGYADFKKTTGLYGLGTQKAVAAFYAKHKDLASGNLKAIGPRGWDVLRKEASS